MGCQDNVGQTVATGETTTEDGEGGEEDYEDYEDEEEYDENSETIMFHNTATMHIKGDSGNFISQGEVDLRIVYDDDVYGARILAELPSTTAEEDSIVCNHVIAMQTAL